MSAFWPTTPEYAEYLPSNSVGGAGVRQIISTDPAAIGARNAEGLSPIVFAAYWGGHDIVKELLTVAPGLDLWEAATVGATARVGELINEAPALVESRSPDGFTALHLAVFFGHP
jgi:uncharacterized protein